LKQSVFDPQGQTIADALHSLGYTNVGDVRQGKFFELELDAPSAAQAKQIASDVAAKVLANPVIESYRVEVE
jgi:phosphoribosylformylglycinamidine synthase